MSNIVTDAVYLDALTANLPSEFASWLDNAIQSPASRIAFDALLCYVTGGPCPSNSSDQTRQEWITKQPPALIALDSLSGYTTKGKRLRDGDEEILTAKRRKFLHVIDDIDDDDDQPRYCLPSISTTSPIRKKVDIVIYKNSIQFLNPTNRAVEAKVSIASLNRVCLLPTRGKSKPHWTVVMLSSDASDRGKSSAGSVQVIFGIDASTPVKFTTIKYSESTTKPNVETIVAKGDETLPSLRQFCSCLPDRLLPVLEPSTAVFRSVCGGPGPDGQGVAGVEAYRSAKAGTLWFLNEGILWGESKPCEFWAVEDMVGPEGVRLVTATGRTCTVFLKRGNTASVDSSDSEGEKEDDETDGVETEFSMVDGRELDMISQWANQRSHLFGRKAQKSSASSTTESGEPEPLSKEPAWDDDSDPDDEDFKSDSEDVGSGSSSSGSSSDEGGDEDRQEGSDATGSGNEEESDNDGSDGDENELDKDHHPLRRPGAMPRISRAAINAVVDMVNEDLLGGRNVHSDEEEDELED